MALTRLPGFTLLSTDSYTFGNANVSGNVSAGNLKTDHLLYANGSPYVFSTTAAGQNTQVQFNDGNNFAGSSNLTFDKTTGTLTVAHISGDGANVANVNAKTLNGHSDTYFASQTDVSNAVANLVNSAPAALDTLNELANALGNDASYSTTVTNALANKLSTSSFTSTADTWLATKSTSNLSEGTNLYYTDIRANTAIDARVTKSFVDNLGVVASTVTTNSQPNITSLGTLTSLTVSGNTDLGAAGNVKITGGTSGQFLKTDGSGNLTWASASAGSAATITYTPTFKGGLLNATVTTSLAAATWKKVTLDNVVYDTTGGSLTGTASRFTIPAGVSKVRLSGAILGASQTDQFITQVYKNGSGFTYSSEIDIDSSGQDTSGAFTAVVPVTQGDYFELWAFSTLARSTDNGISWFNIEIIEGSILNTTVSTTIGMSTLTDVDVTTAAPSNGQLLAWNSSSSKWLPSNNAINATHANTADVANSVSVANVVGIGNIATINKDGNASNILYGNGVFAGAPVTYSNSNVATYLPTYTGNLIPGNLTVSGKTVLGNVSNVSINGGLSGQLLQTDGLGNVSWITPTGTTITVDNFTANGTQTDFTLSVTPESKAFTIVALAGTLQPRTVYNVTGNVLSFSSAPPATAPIEVTTFSSVMGYGTSNIVANTFTATTITANTLTGNIVSNSSNLSVNTLSANSITNTGTGIPTINSATSINFTASTVVRTTSSPFQFYNCTTTVRDTIAASNGYVIYNTTTNKLQVYANGTWMDLN